MMTKAENIQQGEEMRIGKTMRILFATVSGAGACYFAAKAGAEPVTSLSCILGGVSALFSFCAGRLAYVAGQMDMDMQEAQVPQGPATPKAPEYS